MISVHFPDDDLLADPYLDDDERRRLEARRKKEEKEFWHSYIDPKVDRQVQDALKEHKRLQRCIPPETEPSYKLVVVVR